MSFDFIPHKDNFEIAIYQGHYINDITIQHIVFSSAQQSLIFDIQAQKQSCAEYTTYSKKS
jgi:hypothetical protein